jgi:hypothetical protein
MSIGLQHQLQFDPHTKMLYPALLRGLKESLVIFYRHFTPSMLVEMLITLFKREKNLYMLLTSILLETGSKARLNEVWELTKKGTYILTQYGALEILKSAGYLESGNH